MLDPQTEKHLPICRDICPSDCTCPCHKSTQSGDIATRNQGKTAASVSFALTSAIELMNDWEKEFDEKFKDYGNWLFHHVFRDDKNEYEEKFNAIKSFIHQVADAARAEENRRMLENNMNAGYKAIQEFYEKGKEEGYKEGQKDMLFAPHGGGGNGKDYPDYIDLIYQEVQQQIAQKIIKDIPDLNGENSALKHYLTKKYIQEAENKIDFIREVEQRVVREILEMLPYPVKGKLTLIQFIKAKQEQIKERYGIK